MRIWYFLQPTTQKLIALILILSLWVVPTYKEAIMKGTWEQHHGFPFAFVFLVESTVGGQYRIWASRFLVTYLLIDFAILYLVSCIISLALKEKP